MLRIVAVLALAPVLMGARFGAGNRVQDKQDLIAKLSSDLNKVDHTIEVTKDLIKRSPETSFMAHKSA